ncbi:hypothetical protein, partial [Alistipes finegoldii]|uniref:hypothetical protein n=1 Tax=Alistipes finegoldii TaxID=214856 RepID=UPI003AB3FB08
KQCARSHQICHEGRHRRPMLNSEFIKDKFFDKYIYKVEFAEMLRIVPGNLQECYLFFCRNITYYSAQK